MVIAKRRKAEQERPQGLPDWITSPVVPIDPTSDQPNRRYQAFCAFRQYAMRAGEWVKVTYGVSNSNDILRYIQQACRTELSDFYAIADSIGEVER